MPISFAMYVRLSECNSEAPTRLIVVKFDTGDFHERPVEKLHIWLKSYNEKYVSIFRQLYEIFCSSRTRCFVSGGELTVLSC
jgi:hypothetical protein